MTLVSDKGEWICLGNMFAFAVYYSFINFSSIYFTALHTTILPGETMYVIILALELIVHINDEDVINLLQFMDRWQNNNYQ